MPRILVLVLAALSLLLWGTPAMADIREVPASIAGIERDANGMTGTLTLRGEGEPLTVDAGSVRAVLGGREYGVETSAAAERTRQTMIVIDTSGSMSASGMAAMRSAVAQFLQDAPEDVLIGMTSFADTAGVEVEPTTDRAVVQEYVDSLVDRGNTALFDAVDVSVAAMGAEGDRSLVLLSDGGETVTPEAERPARLAEVVENVEQAGVRVEVVAFATDESVEAVLQEFADAGGGSVTAADDAEAVRSAFGAAASVLESQVQWSFRPEEALGGEQELVIRGTANGRPFTAATVVNLGVPRATPTALATAPQSAPEPVRLANQPSWLLPAGVATMFLGGFLLWTALMAPALKSERQRRVESIEVYGVAGAQRLQQAQQRHGSMTERVVAAGERVMEGRESTTRTMQLIERADWPLRAGEWLVLRVVAVIVTVALVLVFLSALPTLLGVLIGLVLGLLLPAMALRFMARRRGRKFEANLPDVLMLVATSLSSGFSLPQALDAVTRDAAEPARKEFGRAMAETRIGLDVADALDHMSVRMDSENMRWATMAIRIQRQVGGNLADTLRTTAKTLRERESLKRQVRALSAEGRLSAYILIALPVGVFLYSLAVNYEYVSLLWTHPLGILMSAAGILAMVVGVFWMRKVVQIEV
jgi:tight adherence protein B